MRREVFRRYASPGTALRATRDISIEIHPKFASCLKTRVGTANQLQTSGTLQGRKADSISLEPDHHAELTGIVGFYRRHAETFGQQAVSRNWRTSSLGMAQNHCSELEQAWLQVQLEAA